LIEGHQAAIYTDSRMETTIGIDIGGTFIDIVISDADGPRYRKVSSTPAAPHQGVLQGLRDLIGAGEVAPERVARIIHGSTVATNALLESSWNRIGLLTTKGFRDVLEIGRQTRQDIYDLFGSKRPEIVPRNLRLEVCERLDASGRVLDEIKREDVARAARCFAEMQVEAVAVVFLFSYLNPTHEQVAREILARILGVPVVISSDVLPEFREYERTSTTVVTAALRPIVGAYTTKLQQGAANLGLPGRWQIMQSNGTITSARGAEQEPARILLSGPAGGVEGARSIGQRLGIENLITMDLGGTSCDVALIAEGEAGWSTSGRIGGHPVGLPMIDIHTIGAGGGSIATVDSGGALRVGPRSAGASPGPASYGRGGTEPTVTDAHVVLGRLPADRRMGGLPRLRLDLAREAVALIAHALQLSVEEAALGIIEVAEAAMERAIRVISVERGSDPRAYALLAFGGAGPLHGATVARRLAIPRAIVPQGAGVLSAYGLLTAEAGHDHGRSLVRSLDALSPDEVREVVSELQSQGVSELIAEGVQAEAIRVEVTADLRYRGQSHELNIPFPNGGEMDSGSLEALAAAFRAAHEARFGHASESEPVECVTLRVRALGTSTMRVPKSQKARGTDEAWSQPVWFAATGPVKTSFVWREALAAGDAMVGPGVVLGVESTVLIPPGVTAQIGEWGDIVLEIT